ncbi:MAG: alpha/beta hydrolase, partial [Simkania sp.]|nr:alpha/beta hydrolase [Simkania sp.]
PASWWHFNSMKQNLILVSKFDKTTLNLDTHKDSVQIEKVSEFDHTFTFFSDKPLRSNAYVFDEAHAEEVSALFCGALGGGNGLKIENSSWNLIPHNGKVYFVENPTVELAMDFMASKHLTDLGSFTVSSRPVIHPKLDGERATVVLSMNQTNSFASYSHEILTFLFAGVNVLAYDNAGKGLSEGSNSEEGMTEAIRSAGQYLIEEKGLRQNQIVFKGQCAGGLPSSEAAKMFPASHVWVDQAPNTLAGTAKGIALQKAKEASEDKNDNSWFKTFSGIIPYVAPLVSGIASLTLPSYNVVENLKQNHGIQIYTIGVPDENGYGGDEMVPIWERDEIEKAVRLNPMGYYLTITGGTHVTDWWTDQDVAKSVDKIFKRFSLSASLFPETAKTPEQVFEVYTQKPYQADSLTRTEKSVLAVFEAVKNEDFEAINRIMNWEDAVTPWHPIGLRDFLSDEDHNRLLNDAISFSKTLGHQAFTERLMLAKKNNTI